MHPRLAALCLSLVLALPAAARADEPAPAESAVTDSLAALRERLALVRGDLEGMTEFLQTVAIDLERLKRVRWSGYLQARWETSQDKRDTVKVAGSPATYTPANTERFHVRRARLKLAYDGSPYSEGVLYVDAGADRTVRLIEAYVTLLDPWTTTHRHRLTLGQMNVPFGYELERSSSARELPERSRAENVLFPGERDRGVRLVDQWTPWLETTVGVFNGPGIASAEYPAADPSRAKDFVARARALFGSFDVAGSWLTGRQVTALTGADVTTDKTRFGLDGQGYYQAPPVGGGTLRAELYWGHEVNPDSVRAWTVSNASGRLARADAPLGRFATDMIGGYVMWVQNLGDQFQLAGRYDWYDPDRDVDHDQFRRWGAGLHAFWGGLTRLTLAFEAPRTESPAGGRWVDPDDDRWTVQVQQRY